MTVKDAIWLFSMLLIVMAAKFMKSPTVNFKQSTDSTETPPADSNGLDWRVSKGLGSRGYSSIRVSVISSGGEAWAKNFDYSRPFKYKWSHLHLHSTLLTDVKDKMSFSAGGEKIHIHVPQRGKGVKMILFGDPCLMGALTPPKEACVHPQGETETRFPPLLNAAATSIDAWGILGDNFYDTNGKISEGIFKKFSKSLKSRIFFTVPGNHDYWQSGLPYKARATDQFANGFMQFYAQDTIASTSLSPFDFSVDPSSKRAANQDNFNWYYQIGNVGLIGYTSVGNLKQTQTFVKTACSYFKTSNPSFIYLIGHWVKSSEYGAPAKMGTIDIHAYAEKQEGCNKNNFKFIMAHYHCNKKYGAKGFQIGQSGAGKGKAGKCTDSGFMYLDTTGGTEKITYFTVYDNGSGTAPKTDNVPKLKKCFVENGIEHCTHLGKQW